MNRLVLALGMAVAVFSAGAQLVLLDRACSRRVIRRSIHSSRIHSRAARTKLQRKSLAKSVVCGDGSRRSQMVLSLA